jgi:diketogulonate reductase-like aldo/keto reductase
LSETHRTGVTSNRSGKPNSHLLSTPRSAHNPKVAGSNPAPAISRSPLSKRVSSFLGCRQRAVLRWHVEHGFVVIPKSKSSNRDRIAEKFDVFGFGLTEEEVVEIDALGTPREMPR